jgi:hypothetical protein
MNLLAKTWFRVVISLFGGFAVNEIVHISTGDPNRPQTSNFGLLYAIVIFGLLTFVIKRTEKKTL